MFMCYKVFPLFQITLLSPSSGWIGLAMAASVKHVAI